jgi:uncharacterized membrane protein YcaP (DUF421 family)
MMYHFYQAVRCALGLDVDTKDLPMGQMSLRAFVIFVAALLMLRLAHKRFFAQRNPLDMLLALIIASTLSRAINGTAAFLPTIVAGFGLVFLHRALTWTAVRFHLVGQFMKGSPVVLIDRGKVDTEMLRRHSLTANDLMEDLRLNGIERPEAVRSAILERNGEVSVTKN